MFHGSLKVLEFRPYQSPHNKLGKIICRVRFEYALSCHTNISGDYSGTGVAKILALI